MCNAGAFVGAGVGQSASLCAGSAADDAAELGGGLQFGRGGGVDRAGSGRALGEARYLVGIVEVALRDPSGGADSTARSAAPGRYAPDEVRAALTLTHRAAENEVSFACALVVGLPLVFAALWDGRIDRAKAWVFVHHLADLPVELAAEVCAAILPEAGGLTTGQLHVRIAKLIIKLDPERARDEYEKAVTQRAVVGYLNPDGTAVITGNGLAPDEAAAASERIARLAAAARRAGHPRSIDQIRADVYIRLLDGRFDLLTRDQMITALLADTNADGDAGVPDTRGAADPAAGDRPGTVHDPAPHTTGDPTDDPTGDKLAGRVSGVEVRARLDTLIGLNELPGELPGWGPVIAPITRRLLARQHNAQWRWAVADPDGRLLTEGLTRRRPSGTEPPDHLADGGVVELHIPVGVLARLATDPPPGWARVIADIADQHTRATTTGGRARLDSHPGRRLPGDALRRHIQIRDRTCCAPGCRRPARQSEQDHTLAHHAGGPTVSANLDPACAHDHDLKHRGGWTVTQPRPGRFIWASPLGRTTTPGANPSPTPTPPRARTSIHPRSDTPAPTPAQTPVRVPAPRPVARPRRPPGSADHR